ncbi:MAG: zinc-ribbon domain containing protein [Streptomycetaceae bacterium]|nr:zinc-ribbon domain containing protein [Streptomycetaceae bacterium]
MAGRDTMLTCRDCGARFALSDAERQSFAQQGRSHPPSRCSACREARHKRQAETGTRGVAPGFRERRQTYTTIVCGACGASAAVPFLPRPDRPVYCPLCFQRQRLSKPRPRANDPSARPNLRVSQHSAPRVESPGKLTHRRAEN